jgi:hypothetical protein
VVGYHVDRSGGAFQVVAPDAERFEDRVEFLVVDVVVELRWVEFAGVECYWVDLACRSSIDRMAARA